MSLIFVSERRLSVVGLNRRHTELGIEAGFKLQVWAIVVISLIVLTAARVRAEDLPPVVPQAADYLVGPQDVLLITSYDQPELTGKFAVEADGTFTYPFIGRVRVSGLALRDVEGLIKKELVERGFFMKPVLTVAIEHYRSQKVYILGEVRNPGAYTLTGNMRLVEALALAGSTLPTASGEVAVVHASDESVVIGPAIAEIAEAGEAEDVVRIDMRELQNGAVSSNISLRNGDTVFVLRAENVYVFGQVKSPGAYTIRERDTTVLQALSLAGGVTDRGSTGRFRIVRIVDGQKLEIKAGLTDLVQPRDTIIVNERFF